MRAAPVFADSDGFAADRAQAGLRPRPLPVRAGPAKPSEFRLNLDGDPRKRPAWKRSAIVANVSSTEAAALLRKLGKTFTVHYTDGTSRAFVQSLSNWNTSDGYDGETQALAMSYRNDAAGNPQARPTYLYQYGLALDSSRTIASITLPANTDSVILVAIDLLP